MPGSRNRDDFIAAAKSLFASRGFDGVTMRNIADALGLTQAALYYHFTSKDELYLAVLERTAEGSIANLKAAVKSHRKPVARLRALLTELCQALYEDQDRGRLLLRSLIDEDKERGKVLGEGVLGEGFRLFQSEAAKIWPDLDSGEITLSLIASCSYAYTLSDMRLHLPGIAKETPSPEDYADHLIRVLKIGDAS